MLDRNRIYVYSAVSVYFIVAFAYILGGHGWGDDFAMYIMHAENICKGVKYADTGYVYNPLAPTYAPETYPPGFPLLLAPVYQIFGLNFIAFKIEILIFYLLLLFCVYLFFREKLSKRYLILLLLILALNPYFWNFRNEILSDIPAAFLIIISLWAYERAAATRSVKLYIFLGICMFFATTTRSTGICLLFTFAVFELVKTRRISKKLLLAFLIMSCLLILTNILTSSGNSYISIVLQQYQSHSIQESMNSILIKINKYMLSFKEFTILKAYDNIVFTLLFYVTFFISLAGYLYKIRREPGLSEIFIFLYTAIILLWPEYQGIRFFIPVVPFYLFYLFYMLSIINNRKILFTTTVLFMLLTFTAYLPFYTHIKRGGTPYGIQEPYNQEVFNFIKNNTQDSAVIMSTKPRAFCLFTERKGIVFPDENNAGLLTNNLKEFGVDYIVTGPIDYWRYIKETIESDSIHFSVIFDNTNFKVYRVNGEN